MSEADTTASAAPAQAEATHTTSPDGNATANPASASEANLAPPGGSDPERMASRLAKLTKRDRELRQREQQIKEQQADIEFARKIRDLSKSDRLALLRELDVDYGALTADVMSHRDDDDPFKAYEDRIKALEAERESERQSVHKQKVQAAEQQFRAQLKEAVDNAGEFELVATYEAYDDVYDVIEEDWTRRTQEAGLTDEEALAHGLRPMDFKRAARLTEEFLLSEATKLTKAQKVRQLINSDLPSAAGNSIEDTRKRSGSDVNRSAAIGDSTAAKAHVPVTIVNGHVSHANPLPQATAMSREERIARTLERLKR